MVFKKVLIGIIVLLSICCEENSTLEFDYEQVVIQAYLFEGEEVNDIRLTSTIPIGDDTGEITPINDAEVEIIKNSISYTLVPSAGDSGYYHYEGDDLEVFSNDEFILNVTYFDKTATATTTVPPLPQEVELSNDTLEIPEVTRPELFEFDSTRHQVKITWENDSNAMFYVFIQNIEENPDSIISRIPPRGLPGRMIEMPMNQNFYLVLFEDISHYGWHEVTLYRINQEYVNLYISRNQNSRELNEPITNIINGLGVFSAFSSVSTYFNAIEE